MGEIFIGMMIFPLVIWGLPALTTIAKALERSNELKELELRHKEINIEKKSSK